MAGLVGKLLASQGTSTYEVVKSEQNFFQNDAWNAYSVEFNVLSAGTAEFMEFRLDEAGFITMENITTPVNSEGQDGFQGLHINCGNWYPESGVGQKVIGIGQWNPPYTGQYENNFAINTDYTVSPVTSDGYVASDYVLAMGTFRTASCCTDCIPQDSNPRLVIEFKSNSSAPPFYFTPTVPLPPFSPPAPPPPPFPPALPPFSPCSDMLPAIVPNTATSRPCLGTLELCTCEYMMDHRRYRMSPVEFCNALVESVDDIRALWGGTDVRAPSGYVHDICQATCATHFVGACAPPAPPQLPPSPALPPFSPCADRMPAAATTQNRYCMGTAELCTCDYLVERQRPPGVDQYDYCHFWVNRTWEQWWDWDQDKMNNEIIYDLCPATCASYYAGPCSPGERPPRPPSPPPPQPIPPSSSPYTYVPCEDQLQKVITSKEGHCDGDIGLCNCDYIFSRNRGYLEPGYDFCNQYVSNRIGHLWDYNAPEGVKVSDVCQATCAKYYAGPCAPPAPPMPPPVPALPPFPPCTDQLPAAANGVIGYCEGSMAFCTCNYIIDKWRGTETGMQYCSHKARDRISHLWRTYEEAPLITIAQLCPQSCAVFNTGPCAPPAPPSPPAPPAMPPFPPCSDMLPAVATNVNMQCGYPGSEASFEACTCEWAMNQEAGNWMGTATVDRSAKVDFCTKYIQDTGAMRWLWLGGNAPEVRVHDVCQSFCAAEPIYKGPCAPDLYPIWRAACCSNSSTDEGSADGRMLAEVRGGGGVTRGLSADFATSMARANARYFVENPAAYRRHLDAKKAREADATSDAENLIPVNTDVG